MKITRSVSLEEKTRERLEYMSREDNRSLSNFIEMLIKKEWNERHPELMEKISTSEEMDRR